MRPIRRDARPRGHGHQNERRGPTAKMHPTENLNAKRKAAEYHQRQPSKHTPQNDQGG